MTTLLTRLLLTRCSSSRRFFHSSSRSSSSSPLFAGQHHDGRRRRRPQHHGFGRIVATSDSNDDTATTTTASNSTTRLTTTSHQSPVRLIPLRGSTAVSQSGAAIVYLSNYGGGLLSGDVHEYNVHVKEGARLGLVSQGSNRIYTSTRRDHSNDDTNDAASMAQTRIHAHIENDACLVMAPDPITPFTNSMYKQEQTLILQGSASSLVWIDWFSSGRFVNGERWKTKYLQNKTTVYYCYNNNNNKIINYETQDERPVLMDCITLDNNNIVMNSGMDWNGNNNNDQHDSLQINAHASVLLHGPQVQKVLDRFHLLQHELALPHARIRTTTTLSTDYSNSNNNNAAPPPSFSQDCLSGRVFMSISAVPIISGQQGQQQQQQQQGRHYDKNHQHDNNDSNSSNNSNDDSSSSTIYVARLAAESNEDLYRIFHYCLKPLSDNNANGNNTNNGNNDNKLNQTSLFGFEFYKDRIRAVHSAQPIVKAAAAANVTSKQPGAVAGDDYAATNRVQHDSHSSSSPKSSVSNNFQNINDHHVNNDNDNNNNNSSLWWWSAFLLADSALPTGSFAHSAGLEAASQLGLIRNTSSNNNNGANDVEKYVHVATRSYLQQTAPTVMACHDLIVALQKQQKSNSTSSSTNSNDHHHHDRLNDLVVKWSQWDDALHLLLVSNTTACRASSEQGQNLLRVALQWAAAAASTDDNKESLGILQALQNAIHNTPPPSLGAAYSPYCWGNLPSIFGVVCALWKIPRCQTMTLLGYCMARDLVSAAVRLNLVGPLASVGILAAAQKAAMGCVTAAANKHNRLLSGPLLLSCEGEIVNSSGGDDAHAIRMASPGSCAPLLDVIQPCHDLLAVRLFRT